MKNKALESNLKHVEKKAHNLQKDIESIARESEPKYAETSLHDFLIESNLKAIESYENIQLALNELRG